jgi:hypothetical protein
MNHARPPSGRCTHRNYNLSCEEFDELVVDHEGRCAICGCMGPESKLGVLVIDHDFRHGNWAVRGLLCSRCNTVIDVAVRERTPREQAYLASPWWRRRFALLNLAAEVHPEPAVGAVVIAGREYWKRTRVGWEHSYAQSYAKRKSWRDLTVMHAPHEIRVVSGQLALF